MYNFKPGEFSKFVKRAEEGDISSSAQDFLAGIDPFGTWTSEYGTAAEKAKIDEAEHRRKQLIGLAGGILGGATVVPASIFGIIGGIKGLASTPGGAKERLIGGARGFWQGAKTPVMGPLKALRARKALGEAAQAGTLSAAGAQSVKELGELVPIADVLSHLPKGEVSLASKNFMSDIIDISKKIEGGLIDKAKAALKLKDLAKSLTPEQRVAFEEAKHIPEFVGLLRSGKPIELTPKIREGIAKLHEASAIPIAETFAGIGLGGTVGGVGAYVQYDKGRSARRDFEKELAQNKLKPSNDKPVPPTRSMERFKAKGSPTFERKNTPMHGLSSVNESGGINSIMDSCFKDIPKASPIISPASGMNHEEYRDYKRDA